MPWKEVKPMDQKIQLIADWQTKLFTITDLSQKYGIYRKTVYKWLSRYDKYGIDGLKEQSRAPDNHPDQTPADIVKLIVAQKLKNRKRGPKKIKAILEHQSPNINWPAASTIGEWLKKYGLVDIRKRRKNVPPYAEPFINCQLPNTTSSADYKGQFYTRDTRVCYPLTISDNYSRYLLSCEGLPGPRYLETRRIFEPVFREYGLPYAIRTDNGFPFAGTCIGGLSRLSIWWIQLGIIPERIDKGCPQQNSRHERMHRTLKAEALDPIAQNMKEQQKKFDHFRIEYNHYRPHEACNQKPPAAYYKKSTRPYVEKPMFPQYDYGYIVRQVRSSGDIKLHGKSYFLTELLAGQYIGIKEIADGRWGIYYSFLPLGTLDMRKNKITRLT